MTGHDEYAETTTVREAARRTGRTYQSVYKRVRAAGVKPVIQPRWVFGKRNSPLYVTAEVLAAITAAVPTPAGKPPRGRAGSAVVATIRLRAGESLPAELISLSELARTCRLMPSHCTYHLGRAGLPVTKWRSPGVGKPQNAYPRAAAVEVCRGIAARRGGSPEAKSAAAGVPECNATRGQRAIEAERDAAVVMYGLLTAADADELGRRRLKFDAARLATDITVSRRAAA